MKRNESEPVSVFACLAFPAMGCVPLSAMATIGFAGRSARAPGVTDGATL